MKPKRVGFAWLFLACGASLLSAADWRPVQVPGRWAAPESAAPGSREGTVWYRTWVKVPASFFTPHERNLWEESVSINVRDLADAHEIHVNGVKIGAGGQFPPEFRSGREDVHRHKVPVGALRKDEWNEIAIRVYSRAAPGGFLGDAPFIMNYTMEAVLEGTWEVSTDAGYRPGPALAARPAGSGFEEFRASNRVLGRSAQSVPGPRLPPAESLAKMKSADDLKAELLLAEPLVAQPTHLSFDARGRLWVSQYRQYPYPAGVTMVSRDNYYRSYYDRVPPPPPNHDRGMDRISIHEDTDGDGVYDRHKVFQDGLNMTTAAVRGRGGVWVLNVPYLLFYPDRDFDDVPDGPPTVHLRGFGLEDTHAVANGLVWGPDGWLYGGVGSSTTSRITRPGMDPPDTAPAYFPGSMVWRYHPETREFDIFSEGSGNLFGLDLDAQGRLYSGHNGGDTRGWHYVQGGFYVMQGVMPSRFGPPRNPYAFGDLPKMRALNPVRRFSIFGAFAEGTGLPAAHQGRLFTVDPLHNELIESERLVRGATFETRDVGRPLWSEDPAFRPVFAVNAPDGSLFVADFYDFYIAHGQHYQSQIDPESGRIYRLRGRDSALERDLNLEQKSTAQLIALLTHPNKWHRHTAGWILGERRDRAAGPKLEALLRDDRGLGALNALWALQQMEALDDRTIQSALRHPYAPVRMWAVRLLGDRYGVNRGLGLPGIRAPRTAADLSPALLAELSDLARTEPDAEVRAQLASTARRLTTRQAMALVGVLVTHDGDLDDPYIPLLNWWVLEAHVGVDLAAVLEPFKDAAFWSRPIVREHIVPRLMRRYAIDGRRQDLVVAAQLLRLAPGPQAVAQLMKGFEEAYRGRPMDGLPDELLQALAATGQAPLVMRVRQGDRAARAEALAQLRDPKAPAEQRVLYARIFGEVRAEEALPALMAIVAGRESVALRKAALVSLMAFDQPDIGAWAAPLLRQTAGEIRTALLALLVSRPQWSRPLLRLVESGEVAANTVPLDMIERIRTHTEPDVAQLAAKVFPASTPAGETDWARRIAQVETILKQGAGNPYEGEKLFLQSCASCHRLNFKGGNIGPDLTTYQRDNLGTMLPSILNPNAEIREGFQYYMVKTRDGRSLSGFLVDRDSQITVLRGIEGADIALRDAEIETMQPVGRSLMPEGLIDHMSDQQLRDFFAYLRIAQPLTR